MKKLSVKGILFSILIIGESGYYFLNTDGLRFLFPVGKKLLYFFIFNRNRITDFSYFTEKKCAFVCLILCSIYILCAACVCVFFVSV